MARNNLAGPERAPKFGVQAAPSGTAASGQSPYPVVANEKDYFVEKDGLRFAARHVLVEMWGGRHFDAPDVIERAMRDAAAASEATILHVHLHHFSPGGGVSGVAVLAESHISIHTWPEHGFAAIDIFMCGSCDPYKAVPVLRLAFEPTSVQITEQKRGVLP